MNVEIQAIISHKIEHLSCIFIQHNLEKCWANIATFGVHVKRLLDVSMFGTREVDRII